ncbi:MAG: class I SAM-dependent methyltransferase [Promethearchaeota archaeon]
MGILSDKVLFWHDRFVHQMKWTSHCRDFIYRKVRFSERESFLELGCGTGALLGEICRRFLGHKNPRDRKKKIFGIDKNATFLDRAADALSTFSSNVELREEDATMLSFNDESIDVVFCQYFFMWNRGDERKRIVDEAMRVLKKNGYFVCFAEPDYYGGWHEPHPEIQHLYEKSLERAGADPGSGRELAELLSPFRNAITGDCSEVWDAARWKDEIDNEWRFIEGVFDEKVVDGKELKKLKRLEYRAVIEGKKESRTPVYYAFGRKPLW